MREPLDRAKLDLFVAALGRAASGPGRVYLTGGATAIAYGWRQRTIDIDIRLDPEPAGAFESIAVLKDQLDVNVELASPPDFIPEVPGWRERSVFITQVGPVAFYHFDPVSQVLAKLARGYERDLCDCEAMVAHGLASRHEVAEAFAQITPQLTRYPRLDAPTFGARVAAFAERAGPSRVIDAE